MSLADQLDRALHVLRGLRRKRKPSRAARANSYARRLLAASSEGERDLVRAGGKRRGGKLRVAAPYAVKTLGDVLGSLHYTGSCPGCRRQFMSRNERVALVPFPGFPGGRKYCLRCADKLYGTQRRGGKRRFDPVQLAKGTAAELEHAATIKKVQRAPKLPVRKAAELIAKDHLRESGSYYDRLEAVEVPKRKAGLKAPRLKLYLKRGKLRVYIVDSNATRKLYGDFTGGGHSRVYADFIPSNEVWLAEELFGVEKLLYALHELHEYKLMGGGQDYDTAHDASTALEQSFRKSKSKLRGLDAAVRRELRAAAAS